MKTPSVAALLGATLLAVALAGCSSGEPDTTKTTASAEEAAFDWDVAYATCMRDAGHDYPDPVRGDQGAQQIPADGPGFEADSTKCTDTLTKDRGERPVSAQQRKKRDHWNDAYAGAIDCLRKKGYEIEVLDGGWSTNDKITDADSDECLAGTGSQTIGGAS